MRRFWLNEGENERMQEETRKEEFSDKEVEIIVDRLKGYVTE